MQIIIPFITEVNNTYETGDSSFESLLTYELLYEVWFKSTALAIITWYNGGVI